MCRDDRTTAVRPRTPRAPPRPRRSREGVGGAEQCAPYHNRTRCRPVDANLATGPPRQPCSRRGWPWSRLAAHRAGASRWRVVLAHCPGALPWHIALAHRATRDDRRTPRARRLCPGYRCTRPPGTPRRQPRGPRRRAGGERPVGVPSRRHHRPTSQRGSLPYPARPRPAARPHPPPGQYRIWVPGQPPGLQSPPGSCSTLERQVPPGAYLIEG